ncbi:MAG: VIT1/CCC1 transporter family protein [Anaerolineae bacterium]|nr:VIT1/CCC1 transporter family protein [Anaerolineae bacterium]MDW8098693.1 VIT1/CCC1 transporter family protein [Anaerolineae bacterium]
MTSTEATSVITPQIREKLLTFQRNEITENLIYTQLARYVKTPENRRVLEQIAADELRHYEVWRSYSGQDVPPDHWKARWYIAISRLFGLTFGLKLMEGGEGNTHEDYTPLIGILPEAAALAQEEKQHENKLIGLLDEELLRYVSSIVLGLNDALVELTGALAGLTLALQNTRLIALTGAITGIAAALSMGASEYLSTRSEEAESGSGRSPLKAAVYTGFAYIITVLLLILPYLLLSNYYVCLAIALAIAVLVIAFFNYYISVAKDQSFRSRFLEMTGLSLGVAVLSFLIGYLFRTFFGIEV